MIVELRTGASAATVSDEAGKQIAASRNPKAKVKKPFASIDGFAAKLPGWLVLYLADNYPSILAITRDAQVKVSDFNPAQMWPRAAHVDKFWKRDAVTCAIDPATGLQVDPACQALPAYAPPTTGTIAVIDSGVDASRVDDFGGRVIAQVPMSKLEPGATVDGRGHGSFVASLAAGASATYPGAAPAADLVSIKTMDSTGRADTSDVIEAADWILANKATYNIKVANFSLHSSRPNSFKFDPLDHAVERLWFAGVTVVAAAGNFGTGDTAVHMDFAPGNDPFVITVGAADVHDTADTADDDIAPWSAWGPTADGFHKPELSAPGRYMIGAVPTGATLYSERPDHVVATGYMKLSGTSFSAPVVSGIAALLLAEHPTWGPDDVKGALMVTARRLPLDPHFHGGVGEVDAAAAMARQAAPNPNSALRRFVIDDPTVAGGKSFDTASWVAAAKLDASWESASWVDASWVDASWPTSSWASASWESASWESASWVDSSQADAALSAASWVDASWVD